jgi:hypothetical protein
MDSDVGGAFASGGLMMFYVAIMVLTFLISWKVFEKAGKPGWAAIIPIYNMVVLLEIVDKPIWWLLLFFVPVANIIVALIVYMELAKRFGQGVPFAIGLLLLPVVFMAILAFGSAQYLGRAAA